MADSLYTVINEKAGAFCVAIFNILGDLVLYYTLLHRIGKSRFEDIRSGLLVLYGRTLVAFTYAQRA